MSKTKYWWIFINIGYLFIILESYPSLNFDFPHLSFVFLFLIGLFGEMLKKRSFCLSLSFSLPLSVCLSICLSLSLHTAPLWKRINFYQSSISMKVQNINNSFTSIIHEHIYVQFKKNYKRWTHQQAFHILYTLTITIYSTNLLFLLGLTVHWKP